MSNDGILLRLFDLLVQLLGVVRGRPLLYVRIQDEKCDQQVVGGLRFEIENRRRNITSLDHTIFVTYHWSDGKRWSRGKVVYRVREMDRSLDPFRPKILNASIDELPKHYFLSWFRTYKFRPTSGVTTRVRVRNVLLDQISLPRFMWELIQLRWFGRVVEAGGAGSYSEWQQKKRARGPH